MLSRLAPRPTHRPSHKRSTGGGGVKQSECGADHPPLLCACICMSWRDFFFTSDLVFYRTDCYRIGTIIIILFAVTLAAKIVTRLWAGRQMNCDFIPDRDKKFLPSPKHPVLHLSATPTYLSPEELQLRWSTMIMDNVLHICQPHLGTLNWNHHSLNNSRSI
jgi:hypothetical protein